MKVQFVTYLTVSITQMIEKILKKKKILRFFAAIVPPTDTPKGDALKDREEKA